MRACCRSGWGGGLELTRPSICAALLSLALRALVDALRQQTLGRAAFQQVQLDVHYLRPQVGAAWPAMLVLPVWC